MVSGFGIREEAMNLRGGYPCWRWGFIAGIVIMSDPALGSWEKPRRLPPKSHDYSAISVCNLDNKSDPRIRRYC